MKNKDKFEQFFELLWIFLGCVLVIKILFMCIINHIQPSNMDIFCMLIILFKFKGKNI